MIKDETLDNILAEFRRKKNECERMSSYHANIFLTSNDQSDRNDGLKSLSNSKLWQEAIDIIVRHRQED